jgi:endonuclease/exonuclease/phosphatase family metal-dependent hydrolase
VYRSFVVTGIVLQVASTAWGETFLDRPGLDTVRVATWNIYADSPFTSSTRAAAFDRVVRAVDADVWAFQELYSTSASTVRSRFNTIAPLPSGQSWNVYAAGENVLVSRFPLSMMRNITASRAAGALIDLPNAHFPTDLYLMGAHFFCCEQEQGRRVQADALANFVRDLRSPDGLITVPTSTAIAIVGDLNIVGGPVPLNTLVNGNITNEATYGPDFLPDWDDTSLLNTLPTHNNAGTTTWTWRDDLQPFAPGVLDFQLMTDSVLTSAHEFVLNTATMSVADLQAAGLSAADSPYRLSSGTYDHLPVVVDYRAVPEPTTMAVLVVSAAATLRRRR